MVGANGNVGLALPDGPHLTLPVAGSDGVDSSGAGVPGSDIVRVEDLAKHFGGIYAVKHRTRLLRIEHRP